MNLKGLFQDGSRPNKKVSFSRISSTYAKWKECVNSTKTTLRNSENIFVLTHLLHGRLTILALAWNDGITPETSVRVVVIRAKIWIRTPQTRSLSNSHLIATFCTVKYRAVDTRISLRNLISNRTRTAPLHASSHTFNQILNAVKEMSHQNLSFQQKTNKEIFHVLHTRFRDASHYY
jgi:hypothetical protein